MRTSRGGFSPWSQIQKAKLWHQTLWILDQNQISCTTRYKTRFNLSLSARPIFALKNFMNENWLNKKRMFERIELPRCETASPSSTMARGTAWENFPMPNTCIFYYRELCERLFLDQMVHLGINIWVRYFMRTIEKISPKSLPWNSVKILTCATILKLFFFCPRRSQDSSLENRSWDHQDTARSVECWYGLYEACRDFHVWAWIVVGCVASTSWEFLKQCREDFWTIGYGLRNLFPW
jgi:hypothetical protein